jgi:hypothetical protein
MMLAVRGPLASADTEPAPAAMPTTEAQPARGNDEKNFLVRPYIGFTSLDFDLTSASGKVINYSPNSAPFMGLKLGYHGYTISGSIDIPGDNEDGLYGKTDYLDLRVGKAFHLRGHELFVEGFFSVYQGFYIDNTASIDPSVQGYITRPDLWAMTFGGSATYYFNESFSHDATFNELKPRAGSGGSWLARAAAGFLGFQSDDEKGIVPSTVLADFGDAASMYTLTSAFLGVQGGYAYDWRIWRQLMLAGSLSAGMTLASQTYRLEGGSDTDEGSVGYSAGLNAALGWGGETFHGGLSFSMAADGVKARQVDMTFYRFAMIICFGARF